MRTGWRVLGAMLAICLVTNGGVQVITTTAAAGESDSMQYFARMNQERAEHGRAALAWHSDLASIAQAWAQHMASTQELAHNPDLTRQVRNWKVVGENVGEGPTIDDLDHAFMESAEHRDNILDPEYTDVGVGSVDTNGIIWIVIDFREPLAREAPPAPRHISPPVVEHWVRGVAVAPAITRRPRIEKPIPVASLLLRSDLPLAPGCMLRFGWF